MGMKIAGIGEVLWDVLEDSEELGGAPVNFAYHANALGAEGIAISSVGDDERGRLALEQLAKRNVSTTDITIINGATTGYVMAMVDDRGVATYSFPDNVAWDQIVIDEKTTLKVGEFDAICFGSLAQRSEVSRNAIYNLLEKVGQETIKVFDLNIRQQFYTNEIIENSLRYADVLKLNDDEILLLQKHEGLTGAIEEQARQLIAKYNLELVVVTRGGSGSLLISDTEVNDHKGYSAEIVDTIGAGDSFTAATILGLLNGDSLDQINEHANRVAAFVCSQKGAMPKLPASLVYNR